MKVSKKEFIQSILKAKAEQSVNNTAVKTRCCTTTCSSGV